MVTKSVDIPLGVFVLEVMSDVMGIVGNTTLLCFLCFHKIGSTLTTRLMRNQVAFDGLVALHAMISLFVTDKIVSPHSWLAPLYCYVWVSRSLFWFTVMLSESNLVCIAIDRLRAVAFSQSYKRHERITTILIYLFTFTYALLVATPAIFFVRFTKTGCEYTVQLNPSQGFLRFLLFSAYVWLIFSYVIPATVMIYCQVRVVAKTKAIFIPKWIRNNNLVLKVINRPTSGETQMPSESQERAHFTRTVIVPAIFMSVTFILTHAYKVIYFFLYAHQIIDLKPEGLEERLGTYLTTVNSALNPWILIASSAACRKKILAFCFSCKILKTKLTNGSVESKDLTSRVSYISTLTTTSNRNTQR